MEKTSPIWKILLGFGAALGASACCAGPFIFLMLGISGSWIGTLSDFQPLRPYLMIIVLALFLWAGWQLFRPIEQCSTGSFCSNPSNRRKYQILFWVLLLVSILLVSSPQLIIWFA